MSFIVIPSSFVYKKRRGAMFCFNLGLEDSGLPITPNIYEQSPRY